MPFSLIIPLAADNKTYETQMPYVFSLDKDGMMLCVKSISGINLDAFDKIYFTILASHDKQYYISPMLKFQLDRLGLHKADIVVLKNSTNCQAETIFRTIQEKNIQGCMFVKDGDGYFKAHVEPQNSIAIYPLEKMDLINPKNKSYVAVDDNFYITNIIEKKVVSHYFNAGGYCFEDANEFCSHYLQTLHFGEKPYLSHVIFSMLLNKSLFRPIPVDDFIDWGDSNAYNIYQHHK